MTPEEAEKKVMEDQAKEAEEDAKREELMKEAKEGKEKEEKVAPSTLETPVRVLLCVSPFSSLCAASLIFLGCIQRKPHWPFVLDDIFDGCDAK